MAKTKDSATRAQSPTYHKALERLRGIIGKLPLPDGKRLGDYPPLLDAQAYGLLDHWPRPATPEQEAHRRRWEAVGAATTRQEIARAAQAAEGLHAALLALHRPARVLLGLDDDNRLETAVAVLVDMAKLAEVPPSPANTGRGRKRDHAVQRLTVEIVKTYALTTKTMPTLVTEGGQTRGAILDLTAEIFAALGINASPLGYVRAAISEVKSQIFKQTSSMNLIRSGEG
jgi:hypothetical protein